MLVLRQCCIWWFFFYDFRKLDELKLDFGDQVALNSTPKLYVHITNNTAISACYSVAMETFFSKPPTPPEEKKEGQSRAIR